jgi:hypothetical protein
MEHTYGLLISSLGFIVCLYVCMQQIIRIDNHGTYLNHMQYDRQAKTSQTTLFINIRTCYNEDANLECTSDG